MTKTLWQDILLPQGNQDCPWELFHENSKLSKYQKTRSDEEILTRMEELHESFPYEGYPVVELPNTPSEVTTSLSHAIVNRTSTLDFTPAPLSLMDLGTLLFHAYGVTRDNQGTNFPRPFRVIPSAGALYPLEIFFHTTHVDGLAPGLYHYNPAKNNLRHLREGDETEKISKALIQPNLGLGASLHVFLTAVFERSIFKYGDRGYRFILLEAGHVAQNFNLVSIALGLGCISLGGFYDREIDDLLGIDGLTHSTIYMTLIGGSANASQQFLQKKGNQ